MNKVKVRINSDMFGYKKNQTVDVSVDIDGKPIDKFWRDRFKDSTIDNWCEVVITATKKKEPK